ncbi:TonB-dependent receptor [Maribrevibacterium harenarium]|uniref:TonB-dependent receptor n=1 Tax=Maribrevibacterium harenarium TaxID=2589817 RepID=A0A501WQ96_9GAMM|nr:TonB-dependent receptor [Maribrevibacterium harenarium]TPE49171.1 TonB-dependent receptor [Maribrevibacterium harenarium]
MLSATNQIKTMTSKTDSLPAFAKTAAALSILAAISSQTLAAETEQKDPLLIVITTATTTPITASESLASVTVIDKDDIEKQQPQEMTELLAGQPGVDITTNGGYGKATSLFMRGANSSGTKLLIDGVPLYSATLGVAPWQYLNPALFERVEVVRGPRSSLYGSEAVGGVVQLFLKDSREDSIDFSVEGGSFNTQGAQVSASGNLGNTSILLSGSTFQTDGTKLKLDEENKAYKSGSLLFRVAHKISDRTNLKLLYMNGNGHSEYSGGELDYNLHVANIGADFPVLKNWDSSINFKESSLDQSYDSGSEFNSINQAVRWSNVVWANNSDFVFGAEYSEDTADVSYDTPIRTNSAIFGQATGYFGKWTLQANLRSDENSQFAGSSTGGISLGFQASTNIKIRSSHGTAYKAPDFSHLYSQYGSLEIKSEASTSSELGIRGDYGSSYWDLAFYQSDYNDMIAYNRSTKKYENIQNARVRGIEFATGAKLAEWSLGFNATLMDPVNLSDGDNHGKRLQRRVEKSARIDVDRGFENSSLGFTVAGYGDRYDDAANTELLPGYALLNLRASYDFAKDWNAKFTVKNALDKDYETAGGYKNPGVGAFLTVNYSAL